MLFDTNFFIDLEREIFAGQPGPAGAFLATQRGHAKWVATVTLGENELWIAGLALRHGLPLVTRDQAFSRVPGLRVLAY